MRHCIIGGGSGFITECDIKVRGDRGCSVGLLTVWNSLDGSTTLSNTLSSLEDRLRMHNKHGGQ